MARKKNAVTVKPDATMAARKIVDYIDARLELSENYTLEEKNLIKCRVLGILDCWYNAHIANFKDLVLP